MNQIKEKKSLGGLTFPPLKKSVVKIQTREYLQKMHKSLRITNHIKYVTICQGQAMKSGQVSHQYSSISLVLTLKILKRSLSLELHSVSQYLIWFGSSGAVNLGTRALPEHA